MNIEYTGDQSGQQAAYTKIHIICFSAAGTTLKTAKTIAEGYGAKSVQIHNITCGASAGVNIARHETALFAMPVYAGRIPAIAADALKKFSGNDTPAIVVCVYGNREFDDALLELKEISEVQGFRPVSAAAFIAQHSIFPELAEGRPDNSDLQLMREFGRKSAELAADADNVCKRTLSVPGHFPYKEAKAIPLVPKSHRCNMCGACAKACPAGAIDMERPSRTDVAKCISCARCIYVCPEHARRWGGLKYMIASRRFVKLFSARKEPFVVYR